MTISIQEKLKRFYSQFTGEDQVLITINADPDAIACSMAIKRILWRKVGNVTISNINVVKRPDNIAMIELLGVKLVYVDQIKKEDFTKFVIVDSQPDHNEKFTQFAYNAIIDHHPVSFDKAPFVDIKPKYGSAAALLTEYLRAAKIKPSIKLATALFYAIKTDTCNFEGKSSNEDVRAFQFLFRRANIHLARKIEQSEISMDFLKYFKLALQEKSIRRKRIFAHLGSVVNPDVCVLVADFFMKVHTINWSIVSGIYNKTLIIIFRNDGLRRDAGKVASGSFGKLGSAGGHKNMARAEISVPDLKDIVDIKDSKKLSTWIITRVEKRAESK
ncbi:MAG: DHH family phosphoesterase [Proteobacteria bacterium]|nr:DHH family phosphoesterase [Pseudomonadota bacterium]